jgi:hypothetical protein
MEPMERPGDAIVWWERRRVAFNVVILLAGVFTLIVIRFVARLFVRFGADVIQPSGMASFILLYILAVNLCYTLGWVTELLWSDGDTARTEALRPAVYRWGLTFAIAVTLLPAVFVPMFWVAQGLRSVRL